jgi:hypothetical protein
MRSSRALAAAIAFSAIVLGEAPPALADWSVPLGASTDAVAQSSGPPATPTGVTATCVTLESEVTVTWTAVPSATSYTVYDSTTSASSGYAVIASDVTGTSWTSGDLAIGTYWFEVAAYTGVNWASQASAATTESVIAVICL